MSEEIENSETVESDNTLQCDKNGETEYEAASVPTLYRKKKGSLADTAAMQAIICLLIAVGFAAANIVKPELAADIFSVYLDKNANPDSFTGIIQAVADFLKSTPNV